MSNTDFTEMRKHMENLTEEDRQRMREEMKDGYLNFEKQKKNALQNGVPMFFLSVVVSKVAMRTKMSDLSLKRIIY